MPNLPSYSYTGPVDHTLPIDRSKLQGKSVVITGGANGLGEELVRQFAAAGSFVTFGDVDEFRRNELETELDRDSTHKGQFVLCDIRSWDDQVRMFEAAVKHSPQESCDVVIANAGISRSSGDSLWQLDDPEGALSKPQLNIIDVNVVGTLYTFKLAVHYFRKQPDDETRDRCFLITGSITTWIDSPGNWEYTISKYGLRGLMRTARRSTPQQGIRINYIAPSYVKSAIRSAEVEKRLTDQGVEFALPQDVAAAMIRVATDRTINGHSILIVPRSIAKEGYIDAELDDFTEDGYMKSLQELQLRIVKNVWEEE